MLSLVFVALLGLAAARRQEFIVGGSDGDIADYPWQGSYRTGSGSHTCGCVFIGGQFALTAAHCGGDGTYSMEFGGTDRGTGTVFTVASVNINPDYGTGPGFSPNDINIVTATEEISGTNISPATIAPDATNPETLGIISGWGRLCGGCDLPITLQYVEIPIISDDLCADRHGSSFDPSNMICVWDEVNQDKGACNGDSGGPLTVDTTVYGLTSWGRSGCGTDYPSAYNRVGAFNAWICENTSGVSGC